MTSSANLGRLIIARLAASGGEAAELSGRSLGTEEIIAAARELAEALRGAGVAHDEPIVLFIANQAMDLVGFLGVWLAGCVVAPIHVATPDATIQALTRRLGSRFAVRDGMLAQIGDTVPSRRPLLAGAALIVFTSGTTGQPKGVVVGHAALIWKLQVLARLLGLRKEDVVLVPLQLTFIFGIWVSLLSLLSGSRLVIAAKVSFSILSADAGVTILATVPTLLRAICAEASGTQPRVREILTGGEPFSPALAEKLAAVFPEAKTFDLFGTTETGSCDFCLKPEDQPSALGTIGRPTEGVSYQIAEASDLGLQEGVGELQIRTPARMLGYLDDSDLTARAFVGEHFRTGDLARVREDGHVQLVGRSKDIISRGGNKIAPLEIENLFAQHQGIASVLAFAMPDERFGESLHLMAVRRDPHLSDQDLRQWAKDRIERFKIPDAFHFVEALPTGRTGKADRAAARRSLEKSRQIKSGAFTSGEA